ncbi:MAG: AsmA family protein [Neptunomonas phycophila]|uniref:AsmA family protein n=1 Tax=Neptunomonas phycophila TaxID=1572645 RepID=UPI003B8E6692
MGKIIKIVIGILAAVILLGVIAVGVLTALFDPNDYKPEIETLAKEKANIDLSVGGDIDWSFYPWLGLSIADVDVRFVDQPELANLSKAQLAVNIPALFSGKVQMDSILIEGLSLNLTKDKDGKVNWQQPTADSVATTDAEPTSPNTEPQDTSGNQPLSLDIQSISIKDGTVTYIDQQTQQQVTLNNLAINSGQISDGNVFPLDIAADLTQQQNNKQTLAAKISATANITLDLENQQYTVQDFNSDVTLEAEKLIKLHLETDLVANLAQNRVVVESWIAQLSNLKASGNITIEDLNTLKMTGSIKTDTFALNSVLEELGLPIIDVTDNGAFNKMNFVSQFTGDAKTIQTDSLAITVDDTKLNGSASYSLETGRADIALSGNSIIVDRYLPPSNKSAGEAKSITDSSEAKNHGYSKEAVIPVDALKPLNFGASLKMQSITYNKMPIGNVDVSIDARNGLIKLNRANLTMYSGSIATSGSLDVRKSPARLTVNKKINGLQLGEMLTALNGSAPITGALSTTAAVTANGVSVYDIINSLNGTANVGLQNGVIQGIDMAQQLCQTMNNLSALGQLSTAESVDSSTPFAKMGGNFTIKNGVVSNNDLSASLDAMSLSGKGDVNLPQRTLNYGLGLMIKENLFKQSCSVNNKLEGVEWPVLCKGGFDEAPAKLCKPDTNAIKDMLKAALTDKVKNQVKDEVKSKVEDKLKEKLGDGDSVKGLIKGLF